MKKDKEKKKKRLKRASPSPAPVEVVSAGESVQLAAPEAPLVYFLRVAGGKWKTRILWALQDGKCHRYGEIKSAVSGHHGYDAQPKPQGPLRGRVAAPAAVSGDSPKGGIQPDPLWENTFARVERFVRVGTPNGTFQSIHN